MPLSPLQIIQLSLEELHRRSLERINEFGLNAHPQSRVPFPASLRPRPGPLPPQFEPYAIPPRKTPDWRAEFLFGGNRTRVSGPSSYESGTDASPIRMAPQGVLARSDRQTQALLQEADRKLGILGVVLPEREGDQAVRARLVETMREQKDQETVLASMQRRLKLEPRRPVHNLRERAGTVPTDKYDQVGPPVGEEDLRRYNQDRTYQTPFLKKRFEMREPLPPSQFTNDAKHSYGRAMNYRAQGFVPDYPDSQGKVIVPDPRKWATSAKKEGADFVRGNPVDLVDEMFDKLDHTLRLDQSATYKKDIGAPLEPNEEKVSRWMSENEPYDEMESAQMIRNKKTGALSRIEGRGGKITKTVQNRTGVTDSVVQGVKGLLKNPDVTLKPSEIDALIERRPGIKKALRSRFAYYLENGGEEARKALEAFDRGQYTKAIVVSSIGFHENVRSRPQYDKYGKMVRYGADRETVQESVGHLQTQLSSVEKNRHPLHDPDSVKVWAKDDAWDEKRLGTGEEGAEAAGNTYADTKRERLDQELMEARNPDRKGRGRTLVQGKPVLDEARGVSPSVKSREKISGEFPLLKLRGREKLDPQLGLFKGMGQKVEYAPSPMNEGAILKFLQPGRTPPRWVEAARTGLQEQMNMGGGLSKDHRRNTWLLRDLLMQDQSKEAKEIRKWLAVGREGDVLKTLALAKNKKLALETARKTLREIKTFGGRRTELGKIVVWAIKNLAK